MSRGALRLAALAALALLTGCRIGDSRNASFKAAPSSKASLEPRPGKYGDFTQIFADVAESALPAVVSIYTEKKSAAAAGAPKSPFEYFFGAPAPDDDASRDEDGLGSGVVISPDGTILTNNHVVEGADRIRVQFYDDREFEADIVGADAPTDLAVIRIRKSPGGFAAMPLGDSDKLRIGEWVIAVGSPYGLSQTVTTGIISAKGRHNTGLNNYENFLQTDAAINPGNSGGALLNLDGELVGINTAIFSRSGGYQGIGFAIPISMAKKISDDLIRDGQVTRGWLGVSIQPLDPVLAEALGLKDKRGALVGGIVPDSPADKAGVKRGDVITRIDAITIHDPNELLNYVALQPPGSWVEIALTRQGRDLVFKAKITKRDEKRAERLQDSEHEKDTQLSALGLSLEELSGGRRRDYDIESSVTGVVVTAVDSESRADQAGLQEGDVLVEANRARLRNLKDFQDAVRKLGKDARILLLVNRAGDTFFTAL